MNILKIADGVTGLFPKKILVTVVDEVSGFVVGSYKADKESLPEVFDRPMTIELSEVVWRVVKAEWLSGKRLSLSVQEEGYFRNHNKRWMVPTVAPKPKLGGVKMAYDFVMEIGWEEWRQVEFLPAEMEVVVEEEIRQIDFIADAGGLLGYETMHVRTNIKEQLLDIPFFEFYNLVNGNKKGCLVIDPDEIVSNGFWIASAEYCYYGLVRDDLIKTLCLNKFDGADDETTGIVTTYNLILTDWCKARPPKQKQLTP